MVDKKHIRTALGQEHEKYKAALGEFVMVWADTEAEMYRVLTHYAGLSDGVARAIFSGTRAKPMVDYMRTIMHNIDIGDARKNDLEFLLPQIVAINTLRDRVVHFSYANMMAWKSDDPTTRYIDNADRVSRYGNHFVEQVGSKMLRNIIYDLHGIQSHLIQHWLQNDPFFPWEENPGKQTAWLYKPAQLIRTKAEHEPSPRKQKRRR